MTTHANATVTAPAGVTPRATGERGVSRGTAGAMAGGMRDHLDQAYACGAPAMGPASLDAVAFKASTNQCKRCAKVLAALEAGRRVYRGLEPAALEGLNP